MVPGVFTIFSARAARLALLAWVSCGFGLPCLAADWQPVSAEELQMTSEPGAPKAPAIILYRQIDRDDNGPYEAVYLRIKILTEEGRKYGDVEIPYFPENESVRSIQARSIKPDGTITEFNGQIYDKSLVKGRGARYSAKTFTIPDLRVGSILEYRYRQEMDARYVFDSRWILSAELFTRHAKFSLEPYHQLAMRWSWPYGLPPGTGNPTEKRGTIYLETNNVPAFVAEEWMPPEDLLKYRVEFIYEGSENDEKEQPAYWKHFDKERFRAVGNFVDARRVMETAVAQIIAPGDAPDTKLRKLYARVQQIRNVSYERDKTAAEEKREHLKSIGDVGDVWQRGYGNGEQITWLMLALARAAGFEAEPVEVATRDVYFFDPALMNSRQLNTNVVRVKLNGADVYLDPGAAFTPFGMLPWSETAVQGLLLARDDGSWVATPLPAAAASRVACRADLLLTEADSLEGKLTVTFSGFEAMALRLDERHEDGADRKRYLEKQVEYLVPMAVDVQLRNEPDWDSSSPTLVAAFNLRIPGWAVDAGRRRLAAAALFGAPEAHLFEHPTRQYPVYFRYPHEEDDDIVISLPANLSVASLPKPQTRDLSVLAYTLSVTSHGGALHLQRRLDVNSPIVAAKFYDQVSQFYQFVRTSDEQQIVLEPADRKGKN